MSENEPAAQALRWGLFVARTSSAHGFWGLALAGETFDRSGHRGQNQALDDWIDHHRKDASVLANLMGTGFHVPWLGAANPGFQGWIVPGPEWLGWPVTYVGRPPPPPPPPTPIVKRCCPVGPPKVTADARHHRDLLEPKSAGVPPRKTRECGIFWHVTVEGRFSDAGDCSCECCELRLFVNYRETVDRRPVRSTDSLRQKRISDGRGGTEPLYDRVSKISMATPHDWPGFVIYHQTYFEGTARSDVNFIEDVSFGTEGKQPADVGSETTRARLEDYRNRPGDRGDEGTAFSDGGCGVTLTDDPGIPLAPGSCAGLIYHFKAIIRTKPQCKGITNKLTSYTLKGRGCCPAKGDPDKVPEFSLFGEDEHLPWPTDGQWRRFKGNQKPTG